MSTSLMLKFMHQSIVALCLLAAIGSADDAKADSDSDLNGEQKYWTVISPRFGGGITITVPHPNFLSKYIEAGGIIVDLSEIQYILESMSFHECRYGTPNEYKVAIQCYVHGSHVSIGDNIWFKCIIQISLGATSPNRSLFNLFPRTLFASGTINDFKYLENDDTKWKPNLEFEHQLIVETHVQQRFRAVVLALYRTR